jgi:outer membrane protein assembly factor BamB
MNKITNISIIMLMIISALIGVLSFPPEIVQAQGLADTPSPCYRGNAQRTGLSLHDTSFIDGTVKWIYPTVNSVMSSPAIGFDGTLYFGGDNDLIALYPNGSLKWKFTTGFAVGSSPAIGFDNTIYIGSYDDNFYAVYPNGTEKWSYPTGDWISSSPGIDNDGIIYFGSWDNYFYALYSNGTLKWKYNLGGDVLSSPSIDSDGTIYVGSSLPNTKLYAFYPNGTVKWSFTTGNFVDCTAAIADDGTIYFGSVDNKIYALYPNGTEKWNYTTSDFIDGSPAIGFDGTIYIGSYDNNLYALYPNGTIKWIFPTGAEVRSSPSISSENIIYFGSDDAIFYSLYPNGTKKWSYTTGGNVYSSPTIGGDGKVYIGSGDNNLYAFGSNLEAPSELLNPATSAGNGYVELTWDPPTSDGNSSITNYIIYRGTSSGSEAFFIEIGNVTTFNDTAVTNGVKYYYRIKAKNTIGEGPMSIEVDDMPTGPPLAPLSLQATWGNSYVNITWIPPSSDGGSPITNYSIYRGTTSGGETFLIEIGNVTYYNDTSVLNGDTYFYKVSAKNANGEGPLSNEASGTPGLPSAPIGLTTDFGITFAKLTWNAPILNGGFSITNYTIYRGTLPGSLTFYVEIGDVLYYNDTNVINGNTYYYKVAAKNTIGEGALSNLASAIIATIPSEPQNLQTDAGNGNVNITWIPPTDDGGSPIMNYRIYKGETSGGEIFYMEIGNVTYYNDTSVTNGIIYYYKVSAKNVIAEGLLSDEVEGAPLGPPSVPQNLEASSGDSWVNITWDVPLDNGGSAITNYRIYKGTVSGSEDFLIEIGEITYYNDTDVSNGITYYYKVSAKNAVGEGPLSIGTDAMPVDLPSEPQNLQATRGDSYVYLTWDAPSDDGGTQIMNYRIYRDGIFLVEIGNVTYYNDTGLTNGQTYSYNVSANNAVGEGPLSTETSATPATIPSAPQDLQVNAGDGQIVLTWNVSSSNGGSAITNYRIYRGTSAGDLTLLTTVGNVLTYTDTSVTNGQMYYYKVSAVNTVGEGAQSGEASGTPEAVSTDGGDGLHVMIIVLIAIIVLIVIILLVLIMKKKKPGEEAQKKEETSSEETPPES